MQQQQHLSQCSSVSALLVAWTRRPGLGQSAALDPVDAQGTAAARSLWCDVFSWHTTLFGLHLAPWHHRYWWMALPVRLGAGCHMSVLASTLPSTTCVRLEGSVLCGVGMVR